MVEMNDDTRILTEHFFHYKKKKNKLFFFFFEMRKWVVSESGVMMKATRRKWQILYSSVARGRSVCLHAIWQSDA